MKDGYGFEYELYSGKVYIEKGEEYGNVAVLMPKRKENNGLYVIYRCELDKKHIEQAVLAMGWRLEDWL